MALTRITLNNETRFFDPETQTYKTKQLHLTDSELESYKISTLSKAVELLSADQDTNDESKLSNIECAFCFEKIAPTDKIRNIPCSHLFHLACLDSWLTKFNCCCPSCRFDLTIQHNPPI
ncbi:hypothetical protein BB561_000920 [Smittium simulii]|uniref:RING-type domain-containing protein n=1 Tax=Smittium simulii TaxID=133385 RepID=A0A2T9YWZ8_9FUNG|nr:hypothetical protein BB561_000920 [Smittium simulii]